MMNFDTADKMAVISTEKRQEMDDAGRFGRASALMGDDKSAETPAPPKPKKNLVAAEMKSQEAWDEYRKLFDRVSDAAYAAREACQKAQDSVQSEKERDRVLVKCLNDLVAVIHSIRDSRQTVIAERSKEEQDHPELI